MRRSRWPVALFVLVVLASLIGATVLLVMMPAPDTIPNVRRVPGTKPEEVRRDTRSASGPSPTVPTAPAWPRRLKISGSTGYELVIQKDGSSRIEGPDGYRRDVSGPTEKTASVPRVIPPPAPDDDVPERKALGKLIVLDTGVVDVPADAVVTYTGPDRLVVFDHRDGSSTVYYTDGRVVKRNKPERRP